MQKNVNKVDSTKSAVAMSLLQNTDISEFNNCVSDLKKIDLNDSEARIVASALRAKTIPVVAKNLYPFLEEDKITELLKSRHGEDTKNFTKETDELEEIPAKEETIEDEIAEHGHIPTSKEEELEGEEVEEHSPEVQEAIEDADIDSEEDLSEVNTDTAKIIMNVPVDMLDEVKEAFRTFMGDQVDAIFPTSDNEEVGEEESESFNGDNESEMTNEELNERKSARIKILQKVASDTEDIGLADNDIKVNKSSRGKENTVEVIKPKNIGLGNDTSHGGKEFQYNEKGQYHKNNQYPTLSLENSEGNSLKGDNPSSVHPLTVYTMNPELLNFDTYKATNFEGDDSGLTFKSDLKILDNVPTGNIDKNFDGGDGSRDEFPAVPTQMGNVLPKHNSHSMNVFASTNCDGCENSGKELVESVKCNDCNAKLALCATCQDEGYCPSCAANPNTKNAQTQKEDISVSVEVPDMKVTPASKDLASQLKEAFSPSEEEDSESDDNEKNKKEKEDMYASAMKDLEIIKHKLSTAYACSARLAIANIIEVNELDDNATMWLNDGLSSKAMITQTNLMLKTAANTMDRTANTQNENSVRTASVSYNPTFNNSDSNVNNNISHEHLKHLLSTVFTTTHGQLK